MSENERLKEIRKSLNLTQREFSDALDIKQGSYSDVERGKAGISAILLKNLIRRFRVNPLWLCEGEGEMFIENSVARSSSSKSSNHNFHSKFESPYAEKEYPNDSKEQITQLESQQEYLENLKSIIDFLKKEE